MSGTAKRLARRRPRELDVVPSCGAIVGGEQAWLRRQRPDGTEYSLPIIVGGHRCGLDAVVSRRDRGTTKHRCIKHLLD